MSLWTPGGEHRVPREPEPEPAPPGPPPDEGRDPFADLSPEQAEQARQMAAEMAEVRRQLAEAPAAVVVANHVMGLYELAAIHLSQEPPNLDAAQLAIDAVGAIVERLAGRLEDAEPTLKDALAQLRLAYVQLRGSSPTEPPED
jgi:hypothetical protein